MYDDKTIIMVAPNGARRTKLDHQWLPITAEEIAAEAKACLEVGASAMHVHVRDDRERHSLDAELYIDALAAIREAVGDELFLQITTEAVGVFKPDTQMAVVRAVRPESASFAMRELVPDGIYEDRVGEFFAWVKEAGIVPQFLIYEAAELARFKQFCVDGIIPFKRPFCLFALGYHGDHFANPEDVDPYVLAIEEHALNLDWAVCAFGKREPECAATAFQAGGHVRVGFENNIEMPDGSPLTSNAQSVMYALGTIEAFGGAAMTGRETRALLQSRLVD